MGLLGDREDQSAAALVEEFGWDLGGCVLGGICGGLGMGGVDEISVVVSMTIFQPNTRIPCINLIDSNTTLKIRKNPITLLKPNIRSHLPLHRQRQRQ